MHSILASSSLHSVEQRVGRLEVFAVLHLLFPHNLQVAPTHSNSKVLPSNLLLLSLLRFLLVLRLDRLSEVLVVELQLHASLLLVCEPLVVKLHLQLAVDELLLLRILVGHLHDDLSSLLGAEVRLVVLFVFEGLFVAQLLSLLHLHGNESLVGLQVALVVVLSQDHLAAFFVDAAVELLLLLLALLLQVAHLQFVAFQSHQGGFVGNGHILGRRLVLVPQRVVVDCEGAFAPQEHRHVGVVGLRDGLAVQGLLDQGTDVALGGARNLVDLLLLCWDPVGRLRDALLGLQLAFALTEVGEVGAVQVVGVKVAVLVEVGVVDVVLAHSPLVVLLRLHVGGLLLCGYLELAQAHSLAMSVGPGVGRGAADVLEDLVLFALLLKDSRLLNDGVVGDPAGPLSVYVAGVEFALGILAVFDLVLEEPVKSIEVAFGLLTLRLEGQRWLVRGDLRVAGLAALQVGGVLHGAGHGGRFEHSLGLAALVIFAGAEAAVVNLLALLHEVETALSIALLVTFRGLRVSFLEGA